MMVSVDKKTLRHKVGLIVDAHDKMAELHKGYDTSVKTSDHHKRIADIVREILGWLS